MSYSRFDYASIIRLVLLFIIFIMTCVGTARPQYQNGDSKYFLWKRQDGGWSLNYGDIDCGAFTNKMRAAYAFAILACIALAFTFIAVAIIVAAYWVERLRSFCRIARLVALGLSVFSFICLLIAWPISASGRTQTYCGATSSLADNGYGITEGLGLLIASWVLLLFDVILAVLGLFFNFGNASEKQAVGTV